LEVERLVKVTVNVDINTAKILKERGLGGDNRAQKTFAARVKAHLDPYTPYQNGGLMTKTATIAPDGSAIVYNAPYAHYQYYGKVMAGRAPKRYTGDDLTYSGAPMRGAQWDKRMLADKHDDLVRDLKTIIGGG
jgi:hypothetical protein